MHQGSIPIILATFAFGLQLYLDFSGYSDIAIGSARLIGFKLPRNFNNPYFAVNPQDFWSRWHISLSSFIRDYLYIPLGGNRKGATQTYLNLLIAMTLCGIWHGATLNFLIWGSYHGVLLAIHRAFKGLKLPSVLSILITQYFVFLGWLIFRVEDLRTLKYCIYKFVIIDAIKLPHIDDLIWAPAALFAVILLYQFRNEDWIDRVSSLRSGYWIAYLVTALLAILIFAPSSHPNFFYVEF
jgi:D-alanyl-lipoteichoic acid acyltransferase DltB (MBOAT superfamily)